MAKESNNFEKIRAKTIVRAWKDPRFKEKLLKNPRAAFKEMGLDLPANFQIKVVEDKPQAFTFVLPPAIAQAAALSDQELERLAGGLGLGRLAGTFLSDFCEPV